MASMERFTQRARHVLALAHQEAERAALKGELGDVLWYLTQICTELDLSLDDVAGYNLEKLFSRLERGKIGGDGDNR